MPDPVAPAEQLLEHIDTDGRVLEVVTRARMRAERLRHRCTYVVVIDSSDRVVVHRRAEWKDVYPGWWDLAFGGVCDVGEDWVSAARRELAEEAGLTGVALWPLGSVSYDAADGSVLGEVYLARSDEPLTCPDGEVVELDTVPIAELDAWATGRDVCLDSRQLVLPLVTARAAASRATASPNTDGSPDE